MHETTMFLLGHLVCLSQWYSFLVVDRFYLGKGRLRRPYLWVCLLTLAALAYSILTHIEFFSLTTVLANTVYLVLLSLCFGGTWSQKLMASLINGVICLLSENTLLYLLALWEHVDPADVWKAPFSILCMTISNLVVGSVAAYYIRGWRTRQALEPLQVLVTAFFPGVVVLINIVLMVSDNAVTSIQMDILLTLGLTVAVLVHLVCVDMINGQVIQRRNLQFRAALEQEQAEALMDSYTTQRRLTHEFTNHLDALNLLLQQGDTEGAIAYLNTVSKTVQTSTTVLNSHNPLLDALLSKKYEEASRQGIMVYFDLSDLREIPLRRIELVTVVSNLMNNAIEAAAKSDQPEVHFRMYKADGELLLSVRNRVAEDVPLTDGQLPRSTKHEPGHGMGLYNVQETIRRCGGESTISCRDHWFRVTCSVPCNS